MKTQPILFLLFFLLCIAVSTHATELRFNKDKKFRIIQVTDSHIIADSIQNSMETVGMLRQVLDVEKPDLVIFTGDIVTGGNYKEGFDLVIEPVISRNIPYITVLGNHDDEQDLTREEVGKLLMTYPGNLSKMELVDGITGVGNFTLEIKGSQSRHLKCVLYCMDSNAYSTIPGVKGYGWFTPDQIEWYKNKVIITKIITGGNLSEHLLFSIFLYLNIEWPIWILHR
ncbi:MAG: metallophosphoesterase [Tannerellaceae bacterium]|nr:metallophosphoesterase [Tannerellaceae bacterium]